MHFLIAASTIFSCNSPISAKATRLLFAACLTAMELSARAAIAWSKNSLMSLSSGSAPFLKRH